MATDARIAVGLPQHPKTKKLIKRLGQPAAWNLVCLILWVAANRSDGSLDGLSVEDIELSSDWAGEDGAFVAALLDVRFLDEVGGCYVLHDWTEHNPWAAGADARNAPSQEKKPQRKRRVSPPEPERPEDVDSQTWGDWVAHRRRKSANVSATVIDGARKEAQKAGMTLQQFLAAWCLRGSQGFAADWIKPHERGSTTHTPESFRERDTRHAAERVAAFTGGLAHDKRALAPLPFERDYSETIEGEAHEARRIAG